MTETGRADVICERVAILSDVHGNLGALEAVLDDISARGITQIFNLGDLIGKGPRGSAVVDRCREVGMVTVRGNWDDFIGQVSHEASPAMRWWRRELSDEQANWLGSLPLSHDLVISGRRLRLFHASAESPHVRVHLRHSGEQFDGMFRNTDMTGHNGPVPNMVAYGDIHDAFIATRDHRTLLNVGSVGNPLDEPTPSYVVVEGVLESEKPAPFGVQFVRVPYDVDAEIAVADRLNMPEADLWAAELRTAIYRGRATRQTPQR